MAYEIRLSNVPDGAYTESYLGASRYQESYQDALEVVAQFDRSRDNSPHDFEPGMEAEILQVDDDELRDRYQVRVIAAIKLGRIISTTDDAGVAKATAEASANDWHYGTAIIDTEMGTVDFGDKVVPLSEAHSRSHE